MPGTRHGPTDSIRGSMISVCAPPWAMRASSAFRTPRARDRRGPALRTALRRRAGGQIPAHLLRTLGSCAARANGRGCHIARRRFLDELVFADGSRLQADLVHRLQRLSRRADRAGPQDRLPRLERRTAVRSGRRNADRIEPRARPPYTEASARGAGWRWRIPLQHRAGNGYVYSSAHISDNAALEDLLSRGRRKAAGGAALPALRDRPAQTVLESQLRRARPGLGISRAARVDQHPPRHERRIQAARAFPGLGDSLNRTSIRTTPRLIQEIERIRDFIVLHYCLTGAHRYAAVGVLSVDEAAGQPAQRIELYQRTGRVRVKAGELFTDLSWFYIFEGMGVTPESYDPLARRRGHGAVARYFKPWRNPRRRPPTRCPLTTAISRPD